MCDEPSEGCEAEDELEGGLPLAKIIGSDDLPLFDGDLAKTSDEKFAGDDNGGDPHWAEAEGCDVDESCGNEDFVSKRIEEFSKGGDEIQLASQVAIEEI